MEGEILMVRSWLKGLNVVPVDGDIPPQASPERVFIYMLLLNSKDLHSNQPFYVGYAHNLKKRLSNHAAINWHMKRFDSAPKMLLLGSIHLNFAEKAVADLESQLLKAELLLLGRKPLDRNHIVLEKQTIPDLRRYTLHRFPTSFIIQKWDVKWGLKHKQVGEAENSNTMVTSVKLETFHISQQLLVSKIKLRNYKTNDAVRFSQKLAKTFDELAGQTTYVIPSAGSEKKQTRLMDELASNLRHVSADWELVGDANLSPGKVLYFKPTQALAAHLCKHS